MSEASSGSCWSIHELTVRTSAATASGRTSAATDTGRRPGDLRRDADRLSVGTDVRGVYDAGRRAATIGVPVKGFGWTYSLPPTAAVTFAVRPAECRDPAQASA